MEAVWTGQLVLRVEHVVQKPEQLQSDHFVPDKRQQGVNQCSSRVRAIEIGEQALAYDFYGRGWEEEERVIS